MESRSLKSSPAAFSIWPISAESPGRILELNRALRVPAINAKYIFSCCTSNGRLRNVFPFFAGRCGIQQSYQRLRFRGARRIFVFEVALNLRVTFRSFGRFEPEGSCSNSRSTERTSAGVAPRVLATPFAEGAPGGSFIFTAFIMSCYHLEQVPRPRVHREANCRQVGAFRPVCPDLVYSNRASLDCQADGLSRLSKEF